MDVPKDYRLAKYGIDKERWLRAYEEQEGKCKLCLRARKLQVDHDHETGFFRGLLCSHCNTGIGMFEDDPETLERAIAYLKEHNRWRFGRKIESELSLNPETLLQTDYIAEAEKLFPESGS